MLLEALDGLLSAGQMIPEPAQSLLTESREEFQGDLPIAGITQAWAGPTVDEVVPARGAGDLQNGVVIGPIPRPEWPFGSTRSISLGLGAILFGVALHRAITEEAP